MKTKTDNTERIIGVISDTHGILRPQVKSIFAGCDQILHAGDVGGADVLEDLARIAPVTAVRGNMDHGSWSNRLPGVEMVTIEGVFFYILHDLHHLDLLPTVAGIHVVVNGHTHRPKIWKEDGVIYLNPGSAGHRRFDYPVSVALVEVKNGTAIPRIIEMDV